MEHIIQFGVTIDDEAIEKQIIAVAMKEVKAELMENITRNMPHKFYSSKEVDWSEAAAKMLHAWFEENRDELMDMAASKLAEKAFRSKAWKERYDMLTKLGVEMVDGRDA